MCIRDRTKPPAASVLRLSSTTLSYLYTSRRCGILLCVSNSRRVPVFSKCSFLWYSAYFHSALYPSFRTKKIRIAFSANYLFTTFCVPQHTPSRQKNENEAFEVAGGIRELSSPRLVQYASCLVRELTSPWDVQSASRPVRELAYLQIVQ